MRRNLGVASLTAAAALVLAGCSSVRARETADVESPGMAPIVAPPSAGPTVPSVPGGPVQAQVLAQQAGLSMADEGSSVLLSGPVRARFFPGSDRMSIDGRISSMGAPARRDDSGLLIPANGADAVRRAASEASHRKPDVQPWTLQFPKYEKKPLPPINFSPTPAKAFRGGAGGDPAWASFAARERDWRWIVVHHSDDESGCCAKYDKVHRDKGWDCCGYDFVIGNGTQTADGQVEVGPRWVMQQTGAHAKTPDNRFNEYGVGIVLVGEFEHGGGPTTRQYEALVRLTKWLMARYHISADRVLRHGDCKPTACPGKNFPWARFIADIS